jgi:murein peptide amidase A
LKRPFAALLLTFAAASPAGASVHRYVIGRSEQGRPIRAIERGDPAAPRRLLVFGLVHGNEPAGRAVARRLAATKPPPGLDVWVVEDMNPDGFAARTRQNAHGVDLNRNFPYRWRRLDRPGGTYWSGPGPASERETRAARALILRVRPTVTVWYHQHLDLIDLASGGDTGLERRYARLVGMRAAYLPRYPGTATGWQNHTLAGSTAFVVELAAGALSAKSVTRHVRALLTVATG